MSKDANSLVEEICSTIESKSKYSSNALVMLAIVLTDGQHHLHSAAVTFVDKTGLEKDETCDYGELLLLRKQLSPNDVCRLLRELVKDHELKVGDVSLEVECNVSRLNAI